MSEKLRNLAERREFLVSQAAEQRLLLAQNVETWRAPIALVDRGLAAVSYIKRHPISAVSASLGLFTVMQSSRASKWLQRVWLVWQIVRRFRGNHTK